MKPFYALFALLLASACTSAARAQISIEQAEVRRASVRFSDPVKFDSVRSDYFSPAKYRAERAAIRKERNFLEFGGGLMGTLTAYNDPWRATSGGDNAMAVMANFNLHHTFTKERFFIETRFDLKFGYNRMDVETEDAAGNALSNGVWFKNQDEFSLSTAPAYKLPRNWSLASNIKFRSQIANGYVSRTSQTPDARKSSFMAPGYLDISLGFTWSSPKSSFPVKVNLSPIALSAVFVESAQVRGNIWDDKPGWDAYGLAGPGKTSKYEGGSSIQIDFDRTFFKGVVRYRTTLFSFYGWITSLGQKNKFGKYAAYQEALGQWAAQEQPDPTLKPQLTIHPTVRWENKIDIKATRFLTTNFSFQLYYNRAQNTSVQTETLLSVGLTYTFKNK